MQCGPPEEVDGLMRFRNQKPLLGAVAVVTFESTQSPLPVILWYGAEDNNYHMVEYNFAGNQACVISVGDGVDFDVEDLVMEYEYEYEKEVAPKIMYEDDLADKLKVVLQELSDVMKARKDQIEDIRNQITVLENQNEDLERKVTELMRDF